MHRRQNGEIFDGDLYREKAQGNLGIWVLLIKIAKDSEVGNSSRGSESSYKVSYEKFRSDTDNVEKKRIWEKG